LYTRTLNFLKKQKTVFCEPIDMSCEYKDE
jgi:hypothetical protein